MSRRTFDLLLLPQAVSASAQQTIAIRAMLYRVYSSLILAVLGLTYIYMNRSPVLICVIIGAVHPTAADCYRASVTTLQNLEEIGLLWPLSLHLVSLLCLRFIRCYAYLFIAPSSCNSTYLASKLLPPLRPRGMLSKGVVV